MSGGWDSRRRGRFWFRGVHQSYPNENGLTINVTAFVDLAYGTKVFSVVTSVAIQPEEAVTSARGLRAEFAAPILSTADLIAGSATQLRPPDTALDSRLRGAASSVRRVPFRGENQAE